MGALHYLFGFTGRLNRAKVWLYLLIAIGIGCVFGIIAAIGFDVSQTIRSIVDQARANPRQIDWSQVACPAMKGPVSYVALALLIVLYVAAIWIKLAVYAKRLHDRNRSAWWLLAYMVLPAVLTGYHMLHAKGAPFGGVAHGLALLIGLWVFIDLWCLSGTKGSNRFGVDPLAKGPVFCEPGKPVHGCVPKG